MLDHEPTSDWGSLLRISSTSADRGAYGDRLLTVLTHPGSHRLHVVCGTPRDPDASCDTAKVLTPGVAHTLKIVVAGASCIVLVDGRRAASKTGLSDRTRQPAARVLATDGFGVAARARLRKLSVQSVEATQPLQTLLGSAGSESAAAASPASDSSPASTFVELTTGLAAWRQTRSHGSFPAGKAPITAPHAAWFRPAPREGAWLGCSSAWPVGEVSASMCPSLFVVPPIPRGAHLHPFDLVPAPSNKHAAKPITPCAHAAWGFRRQTTCPIVTFHRLLLAGHV
jgi:hypothetical protein